MVRQDIDGWIKNTNFTKLCKRIKGRKVYVWGAFTQGNYVKKFLESINIGVEGFIDFYKTGYYEKKMVSNFSEIKPYDDKFIFIAINEIRPEIIDGLNKAGLKADEDYCYIFHKYIVTPFGNFKDIYNNKITIDSYLPNLKIEVVGYGSKVYVGKDVMILGTVKMKLGSNSFIKIEDGARINGETHLTVENNSTIIIGKKCIISNGGFLAYKSITIGDRVNLGDHTLIVSNVEAPIEIGNDCLFSHDIQIRSGDGHSIFDLEKHTSLTEEKQRFVNIGNHVWCGSSVTIIHNADIGSGCVIGTGSFVNKKFNCNELIAGRPATVIRKKIVWEDEDGLEWKDYLIRELDNKFLFRDE